MAELCSSDLGILMIRGFEVVYTRIHSVASSASRVTTRSDIGTYYKLHSPLRPLQPHQRLTSSHVVETAEATTTCRPHLYAAPVVPINDSGYCPTT